MGDDTVFNDKILAILIKHGIDAEISAKILEEVVSVARAFRKEVNTTPGAPTAKITSNESDIKTLNPQELKDRIAVIKRQRNEHLQNVAQKIFNHIMNNIINREIPWSNYEMRWESFADAYSVNKHEWWAVIRHMNRNFYGLGYEIVNVQPDTAKRPVVEEYQIIRLGI